VAPLVDTFGVLYKTAFLGIFKRGGGSLGGCFPLRWWKGVFLRGGLYLTLLLKKAGGGGRTPSYKKGGGEIETYLLSPPNNSL